MRFYRLAPSTVGRGVAGERAQWVRGDPESRKTVGEEERKRSGFRRFAKQNTEKAEFAATKRTGYGAGAGESRREQRARRPLRQEDLDPAAKPPLSGEGDRVSGGRVENLSFLLYYPHLFLRKETVVTARESGDRPLLFATADSSPIKGRRQATPCKMNFARCHRNGAGGARPDSGSRREAQQFHTIGHIAELA